MMWVVDTSALIRLFVPDGPLHPEVESAFSQATRGVDLVLAPHLLLAETANVLLRKHRRGELSVQELDELLKVITSLPIRLCEHGPLLLSACNLAQIHNLSVYDSLFLALAERHGARLITNDDVLHKVAHSSGLV